MTDMPTIPTAVIAPTPTAPDYFVPPDPARTVPISTEVSEQPDGSLLVFDVARHPAARYALVVIRTEDGGWQVGLVEPEDILEHGTTNPADGVRIRLVSLTITDFDPTTFGDEREAWAAIGSALDRAEQDYTGKAPQ